MNGFVLEAAPVGGIGGVGDDWIWTDGSLLGVFIAR